MQTAEAEQAGAVRRAKTKRTIVDCDIHNYTGHDVTKAYLPSEFRDWQPPGVPQGGGQHFNGGVGGRMVDSFPPDGRPAGSNLEYMQSHHLDPHNVEYGILTGEGMGMMNMNHYEYAAALCTATNEYCLEQWSGRDSRLKTSVMIPKQAPELAAKEIDRIGGHRDVAQVLVCSGARLPYGNRVYDPIYAACERHNLPFTIHIGAEGAGINSPMTNVGYGSHYIESRCCRPQVMMAHLASYIFEGTFERFPTLKVLMQESGVLWVVPYLWQLDQLWMENKVQVPWMKKAPSEYFRQHVRMSTQPFEITPNRALFDKSIKSMFADETLMFCSDYPHWDYDSPLKALPKLDDALWERVYYETAAELYGFPKRSEQRAEKMA
ncbi:MAG: amidohydrolase [Paenibacillus sp.]|jgi:predicted TIM-barrel fold metal-dependent hydrolase|nr:amidohydrolase [Paenibacillus sp.]